MKPKIDNGNDDVVDDDQSFCFSFIEMKYNVKKYVPIQTQTKLATNKASINLNSMIICKPLQKKLVHVEQCDFCFTRRGEK